MGWRATAQRLNLNRDYLKGDAPEMQAMIRLYQKYLPDFYIDCHVTDGADYIYPLTYGLQMHGNLSKQQSAWLQDSYLPFVENEMQSSGNPIAPYLDFVIWHDPKSGIKQYMETPRYSGGYAAINNRPSLLIETHMLKDYRSRVTATYEMLLNSLRLISKEKKNLLQINSQADLSAANLSGQNYVIAWEVEKGDQKFTYEGFEYDVVESELTGGNWYQYTDKAATYEIDYYERKPGKMIKVPHAYIIPSEWKTVIDKLELHNLELKELENDSIFNVHSYRFENVLWRSPSFEGRNMLDYTVKPTEEKRFFPKGSKIVFTNQVKSQVAIHMLEPEAPDALVRWGFFNTIFEQKEYAESYVMEKMAREMLANDPELARKFDGMKKNDPDFTKSSYNVINWFYQQSLYWDNNMNVYPIGRIQLEK